MQSMYANITSTTTTMNNSTEQQCEALLVSDNNNEFSSDPNPYAFPYFHSSHEIPALYKYVNGFLSLCSNASISPQAKYVLLLKSGKKIIDRCQSCPTESGWVDSCGENALHRLCQLVRFDTIYDMYTSAGIHANAGIHAGIHLGNNNGNQRQQRIDELTIDIVAALIKAEPRAPFTINNWNETPLHQFVAHCGLEHGHGRAHEMHSDLHSNLNSQQSQSISQSHSHVNGFSSMFLKLLINASPQSVFTENYERALPIHEVCTLSQMDNTNSALSSSSSAQHAVFPYPSLSIHRLMSIHMHMMCTNTDTNTLQALQEQITIQEHIQHIHAIAAIYPKGFLCLDLKKRSPLYRAVESMHCSSDSVIYILRELEKLFSSTQRVLSVQVDFDEMVLPRLVRRAILGLQEVEVEVSVEVSKDGHHSVKSASASTSTKQLECKIASPLEGLWDAINLPRQKPAAWDVDIDIAIHTHGMSNESESSLMSLSALMARSASASSQRGAQFVVGKMGHMWKKMMVLMCAAYHGSVESIIGKEDCSFWFPLHAAIFVSAPMGVVQVLTRLYPNDCSKLHFSTRDRGETPLTFALSKMESLKAAWDKERVGIDDNDGDDHDGDDHDGHGQEENLLLKGTVEALLGSNGSAASLPNSQGRLPLHIAIEKGLGWSEGTAEIYSAYPVAVSVRDPMNGDFPFLAAASKCNQEGVINLSSLYLLLKTDPSVVALNYSYHE